jgi:uncharacterized protein (TIGR02099 family)
VAYFAAAVAILGLRYWVLPHIDQWRPYIAQQLSQALNAQVSLGHVGADWSGLNPTLQMQDVNFIDNRQRRLLHLPQVKAELSWRSLLRGSLQFVMIEARGLDLSVRRDAQEQLQVLGYTFALDQVDGQTPEADSAALRWLATQRQVVLRDSTLRWIDELRQAPPLVLRHVTLKIHNQAPQHQFSLVATPPGSLGQSLDIRGQLQRNVRNGVPTTPWSGQIYAEVGKMLPLGWKPWVDLPQDLRSGEVSAQAWLGIERGSPARFTSDVTVKNGHWKLGPESDVEATRARLYLSGPWPGFERIFSPPALSATAQAAQMSPSGTNATAVAAEAAPAIEFRLQMQDLGIQAKALFQHPLDFTRISAQGSIGRLDSGAMRAVVGHVDLVNNDMDARLQGSWQQGGTGQAGLADIRGTFKRAAIAAIDDYLPNSVSLEAREWMDKGLVHGQIHDAQLLLKGDLEFFPFSEEPDQGDFEVQGRYVDGIIDYLPTDKGTLGWPRLSRMSGTVSLHRADLQLTADQAVMQVAADQTISLSGLAARIPNIEHDSVLSIQGDTTALASAYLALLHHSPLGGLLGGDFDEAQAQDTWQVPLALTIPLLNSRDTTVQGAIRFGGGTVSLMPEMPPFKHVSGVLNFTDVEVVADAVKAEFLGGPVAIAGGIGGTQKGLQIQGQATSKALTQYVGLAGMERLRGRIPYRAQLRRPRRGALDLALDSTLEGLALDFPEPVGKPAAQPLPLHMDWQRSDKGNRDSTLNISLGRAITARLLHRKENKKSPYFYAGTVAVNQTAAMLPEGLNIDVENPRVDMDVWSQVFDEFSTPVAGAARRERPLLPDVQQLRLQARAVRFHGLDMDLATFTAKRPAPMQWRVDISSSQTAGTLFWREASGKIAGRVDAKFDRLALGRAGGGSDADSAASDSGDDEADTKTYDDVPAINLDVRRFSLYGHELGQLSLVGVNQSRGTIWKLNTLHLTGASTQLSGSGIWRLKGPDRGLTLDAKLTTENMGAYLDQMGYKNRMSGGKGSIEGKFDWHNLPWRYKMSDLSGRMEFSLQKGRFSSLNSRSARLLELLSLQSVQRLATFNVNPAAWTRDGFPYDNLRGTVQIKSGVMTAHDYRVTGPAGTIVLGGDVNLNNDLLDLQAVVVPNLDVSGAALAAGIAINPIVGLGAFLTQWLLKTPLAKAMTVQYQINGDWNDPKIKEVSHVVDKGAAAPVGH